MGAITQAMAKAAAARGVDIRLSTQVRRVVVENGHAIGVETDKGETIRAAAVAAGINPKLLYLHLVDARALPEGFRRRMENWRCGSGTFRMNVALSELPDFTDLPGRALAEHHASGIIIAPSLAYMEQAYFDARTLTGRAALSLNWSFRRHSTARSRRVANMSRASSVSMSHQNSPMVRHGTTTVKLPPIS
jgi:phytoene dehydrogenase-like protein